MRLTASCLGQSYLRHSLVSNRPFSAVNISPKRERSCEMTSPLACILGPILCLPRATRFLRLVHLNSRNKEKVLILVHVITPSRDRGLWLPYGRNKKTKYSQLQCILNLKPNFTKYTTSYISPIYTYRLTWIKLIWICVN